MEHFIKASLVEASNTLEVFLNDPVNVQIIDRSISQLVASFKKEGKTLSCGNGGSMCDAMHFAEELTGRFRKERRPLPAMAVSDPSYLTCTSNDYGYDHVFSRYVKAFGKPEDTLIAISTSGNSANVIQAVEAAKHLNMKVIGLLGKDGGKLREMVDFPIIVKGETSDRIQEVHIKIIHILIEGIERHLFPQNYNS